MICFDHVCPVNPFFSMLFQAVKKLKVNIPKHCLIWIFLTIRNILPEENDRLLLHPDVHMTILRKSVVANYNHVLFLPVTQKASISDNQ